jgi:hypothetical protein
MSEESIVAIIIAVLGSTGLWTVINQHFFTYIGQKRKLSEMQKDEIKNILKPTNDMVLGIGYDRLIHVCNKYIDRGWIDIDELNGINKYLYEPYRELGGDGMAEMLFDKLQALPNKPKED